eukprot:TRINITY_DN42216_c0_g1_i1.p1 TRINITY_DN42216_c0_g1~~TRINITY_DN42216_c0_g1_i1.p1  ORF type:complete len:110 (-),score=3.07 TRINITY_DN42216_c0_g1_i1:36-317(-)
MNLPANKEEVQEKDDFYEFKEGSEKFDADNHVFDVFSSIRRLVKSIKKKVKTQQSNRPKLGSGKKSQKPRARLGTALNNCQRPALRSIKCNAY